MRGLPSASAKCEARGWGDGRMGGETVAMAHAANGQISGYVKSWIVDRLWIGGQNRGGHHVHSLLLHCHFPPINYCRIFYSTHPRCYVHVEYAYSSSRVCIILCIICILASGSSTLEYSTSSWHPYSSMHSYREPAVSIQYY